jgi:protein associated with RNAse G/E
LSPDAIGVVTVDSRKYDGSIDKRWQGGYLARPDGVLEVHAPVGTAIESYRGPLVAAAPFVLLTWPGKDFNVVLMYQPGPPHPLRSFYCNVVREVEVRLDAAGGPRVAQVDMDLDLIVAPDLGTARLDDEAEFEAHRSRWGYTAEAVAAAWRAVADLRGMIAERAYPFDGSEAGAYAHRGGT